MSNWRSNISKIFHSQGYSSTGNRMGQIQGSSPFAWPLQIATIFTLIIWFVHLIQKFTPLEFTHYGILPHRWEGIKGIFLSPFLHSQSNWGHIFNNTPTLFAGIFMLYYFYPKVANRTLLYIYLFTGVSVWVVAGFFVESKFAYHIGASGVIYGLISFIFFSGIFRKNVRSVILSLIIILMYSGMVAGLFPDAEGQVSWQSHLMGGVFGMVMAYQFRTILEPDEIRTYSYEQDPRQHQENVFLPSDTFEKTRQQREIEKHMDDDGWTRDWTGF